MGNFKALAQFTFAECFFKFMANKETNFEMKINSFDFNRLITGADNVK